jgi:hypothetical protein
MKASFGCELGVGKDTSCDYFKNKHGGTIVRFSETIYTIMYYVQDKLNIPRYKDRLFLQILGTEWGRERIDENIWVLTALKLHRVNERPNENFYNPDCRFLNELRLLKEYGFYMVRLIGYHPPEISNIDTNTTMWDYFVTKEEDTPEIIDQKLKLLFDMYLFAMGKINRKPTLKGYSEFLEIMNKDWRTVKIGKHKSENSLTDPIYDKEWNAIIHNKGTKEELYTILDLCVDQNN